jgi:methionyl-tRNA synthetase
MPVSSSAVCASTRRILVTSALPYANGPLHLGHLLEGIQADIWVRALRMQGHQVFYLSAEDAHGTPVMLRAQKEEISCSTLIARSQAEHKQDFDDFHIALDQYDSTDSAENRQLCTEIYLALCAADLIAEREIAQAYDPVREMFLPDRFIKGNCPKCSAADQYGDSCEACGALYRPTELRHPYSVLSGAAPVHKTSAHYFFRLTDARCVAFLRTWVKRLAQPEAIHKLAEWLDDDPEGVTQLVDWDISRDAPYFGFEIPGVPGKYFYVWLDAPIGYYASFKNLCKKKGLDFNDWVKRDSTTEQYHFIGKDILYFHTLFWPTLLEFSGYRTPTNIFAHGFLTIAGKKMSKSRGTFITARSYLDVGLDPQWLRYYFATKLNGSIEDLDLKFDDFVARINGDLIGKYINIASRSAGFLSRYFDGCIHDSASGHPLITHLREALPRIAAHYEARDYMRALRMTMQQADAINGYIDAEKPWVQAKNLNDPASYAALHQVCSISIAAFRLLTIALKPVLPQLAAAVEDFLNVEPLTWADAMTSLCGHRPIKPYQHLMQRVQAKQIDQLRQSNNSH